jgi:dethiobiotin synthetase
VTQRVLVLGTGTGVGKTWVSRALTLAFSKRTSVVALKPVESGVDLGESAALTRSDGQLLASVSSFPVAPAPYRFEAPISPHLAARRAGVQVELGEILTYVQTHESIPGVNVTVIESAGGLFTPLAPGLSNFDLARALEPGVWVLAASDSLGVLHDLSATIGLAKSRGRAPDFVVLSGAREPDASTGTNQDELAALGISVPAVTLSRGVSEPLSLIVDAVLSSP